MPPDDEKWLIKVNQYEEEYASQEGGELNQGFGKVIEGLVPYHHPVHTSTKIIPITASDGDARNATVFCLKHQLHDHRHGSMMRYHAW